MRARANDINLTMNEHGLYTYVKRKKERKSQKNLKMKKISLNIWESNMSNLPNEINSKNYQLL